MTSSLTSLAQARAAPAAAEAPVVCLGNGARMTGLADGQVQLVLTSPPYFPDALEPRLLAGLRPRDDLDEPEAELLAFAWGLRPVWAECHRVLAPQGRWVVQVRDVRLRERLVPVEGIHRHLIESLGWRLLARHSWRPVHATLGRRRVAQALAAGCGPAPFDAEAFLVFGRGAHPVRGQPTPDDLALLTADTMVTTVCRLPSRHRFQAPLPVLAAFVRTNTRPGDWVADPFQGGGSTLKVAADLGRCGWGCDTDPAALAQARSNLGLAGGDDGGGEGDEGDERTAADPAPTDPPSDLPIALGPEPSDRP